MKHRRCILYVGDPRSVHDLKWMTFFSSRPESYRCLLVPRRHHAEQLSPAHREKVAAAGLELQAPLDDFSVRRAGRTARSFGQLRRLIAQEQVEVIHLIYAEPSALWSVGRQWLRCPMVLSTLGTDVLQTLPQHFAARDPLNQVVKRLYRFALSQLDAITVTSQRQRDSVLAMGGRPERVSLVRTAVDVARVGAALRGAEALPSGLEERKYVLFPRAMTPLYRHEFSLEGLRLLPRELTERLTMVFVNADSPDHAYVASIRLRMKQLPQVRFLFLPTQSQEALFRLYAGAAAVVMNPRSDGSPVSAMEAMVCRVPVILGPLEYDPDLFSEAFRLSSWNAAELASLLTQLLSSPPETLAERLDRARARVLELGDHAKEMARVEALYLQLLSGAPAPIPASRPAPGREPEPRRSPAPGGARRA